MAENWEWRRNFKRKKKEKIIIYGRSSMRTNNFGKERNILQTALKAFGQYLCTRGRFPHTAGRGELNTFAELEDIWFVQRGGDLEYKRKICACSTFFFFLTEG